VLLNHADLGTELVSGAAKNDFQIVAASA
jgi:hypothetical protein